MSYFRFILWLFLIISSNLNCFHAKIADFSSDSGLFHPFVQRFRNSKSKDYLVKLLKRNLEEKCRKLRLYDNTNYNNNQEDPEKSLKSINRHQGFSCSCGCKNYHKRCGGCKLNNNNNEDNSLNLNKSGENESANNEEFICENEGTFPDPNSCQQFYICYHKNLDPISVVCPRGFAFDSNEHKCTRKAARQCLLKRQFDQH